MRLIILSLITIISLTACREGEAKDTASVANEKPYKATTVDECIEEKECVWFAFQKLLLPRREPEDIVYWTFKRWEKSVSIRTLDGDEYIDDIKPIIEELDYYFPYDIILNGSKTNSFFIFSTDIKDAFFNKYYDFFKRIFVTKISMVGIGLKSNNKQYNCLENQLHNKKKENIAAVLMADTDHKYFDKCIKSNLYGILTDTSKLNLPFDWQKAPKDIQKKITDVDLLLLTIFYSPKFQSGMSFDDIRQNFDGAYKESLIKFLKIKNLTL